MRCSKRPAALLDKAAVPAVDVDAARPVRRSMQPASAGSTALPTASTKRCGQSLSSVARRRSAGAGHRAACRWWTTTPSSVKSSRRAWRWRSWTARPGSSPICARAWRRSRSATSSSRTTWCAPMCWRASCWTPGARSGMSLDRLARAAAGAARGVRPYRRRGLPRGQPLADRTTRAARDRPATADPALARRSTPAAMFSGALGGQSGRSHRPPRCAATAPAVGGAAASATRRA